MELKVPKIWIADDDEAIRLVLEEGLKSAGLDVNTCLLYTSPSPRDLVISRMPSSA